MLVIQCSEWSRKLMKPTNTVCWRNCSKWFVCLHCLRELICCSYNGGILSGIIVSFLDWEPPSRKLARGGSILFSVFFSFVFSRANIHKVNKQSRLFNKAPQWNAGQVCWDIFMVREPLQLFPLLRKNISVSAPLLSHTDSLATRTECPVHTEELIWLKDDAIYEEITHT